MPRSRAVGVMGGTFDPIHYGHLVAASEVAAGFGLDDVLFVPAGQPWQKEGRETAPAEHRFLMTVIATSPDERFSVSRVDLDRSGPTYTVDTLRDLRAQLGPDVELFFITGSDAMAQILTWRDHDEVLRLARMVSVSRPGHPLTAPDEVAAAVHLVEIPALAISSTDIRSRVGQGLPVRYLMPEAVERYIAKTGLYRA